MQILTAIRERFRKVLQELLSDPALVDASLERIVPSRDPSLADYQANIAMPLQKVLGKPPLEIAQGVVDRLDLSDICQSVSVAVVSLASVSCPCTPEPQSLTVA